MNFPQFVEPSSNRLHNTLKSVRFFPLQSRSTPVALLKFIPVIILLFVLALFVWLPQEADASTLQGRNTASQAGAAETAVNALTCNGGTIDFNSGFPTAWSAIDDAGKGVIWTLTGSAGYPTDCELPNYVTGDGAAACAASESIGKKKFDTSLQTNTFDLPANLAISLDYTAHYANYAARDYLDLEISEDNGGTWTTLVSWNEDHHPLGEYTVSGHYMNVDLSAYAGTNDLMLRWRYYDPKNNEDLYAQVDDVSLTCVNPPIISVDPLDMVSGQAPDVQVSRTLTIANSGGSDLLWSMDEAQVAASMINEETTEERAYTSISFSGGQSLSTDDGKLPVSQEFWAVTRNAAQSAASLALINDGSFENGAPPASSWAEFSDGSCEWIGDWGAAWGVGQYDGSFDYWAGGYCGTVPNTDSVSQTITIPASTLYMGFKYLSYRPSADDVTVNDYAYVTVDGVEVWRLDSVQANDTFPNWQSAGVDVSAYAGQTVDIVFGFVSNADGTVDGTGNVRFDYIILTEYACDAPTDLSWVSLSASSGTIISDTNDILTVQFDSTGLTDGTYTGALCVNSNDPVTPRVAAPITMTVCSLPTAVSITNISHNGIDTTLDWTGDGDYYEVWWSANNPYFTPAADCAAASNCALVNGALTYTHTNGVGDPNTNYTYVVRAGKDCTPNTVTSAPSNRKAEFDFNVSASSGWVNIGVPLSTTINTSSKVANYIASGDPNDSGNGSVTRIMKWDNSRWMEYYPQFPFLGDPDFNIETGTALMIFTNGNVPASLVTWVDDVPDTNTVTNDLTENAWNFITIPMDKYNSYGNPSTPLGMASDLASDITGVTRVMKWDAPAQRWIEYYPQFPFLGDPDFEIYTGYPYMIRTDATSPLQWP